MKLLKNFFNKKFSFASSIASLRSNLSSTHGFTLVELLVVMGVIGTLAAGLVVVINPAAMVGKARDAQRKSDFNQIQKALELYYDDYSEYPVNMDDLTTVGNYMKTIPSDPVPTRFQYRYVQISGGQMYRLYAHLENASDPQACSPTGDCPNASGVSNPKCGVGVAQTCNYGVTSPNTSP